MIPKDLGLPRLGEALVMKRRCCCATSFRPDSLPVNVRPLTPDPSPRGGEGDWNAERKYPVWLAAIALFALWAEGVGGGELPPNQKTETAAALPMPAAAAAAGFHVPDGFHVTVFAAEPDVQNPIAMAWDCRGRLWIAENYTYSDSSQKIDLGRRDRVLIFEDADGDGRFDKRTVFTEDVQMLASIEIGLGGVWLLCPPRLLFLPDRDGNDVPDGAAEVVLDGFTIPPENYHTFANGLRWGPDGWLYGRCGASSVGEIGAPGTPESLRVPIRGGVWRYHTGLKRFEVLAHGTTNPWGHDWNALGELFFVNTVNGHLWHVLAGAASCARTRSIPTPEPISRSTSMPTTGTGISRSRSCSGAAHKSRQLARRRPCA